MSTLCSHIRRIRVSMSKSRQVVYDADMRFVLLALTDMIFDSSDSPRRPELLASVSLHFTLRASFLALHPWLAC